MNRHH